MQPRNEDESDEASSYYDSEEAGSSAEEDYDPEECASESASEDSRAAKMRSNHPKNQKTVVNQMPKITNYEALRNKNGTLVAA